MASVIKKLRTAMLSLVASNIIITFVYIYNIMYVISYENGNEYFNPFINFKNYIYLVTILFLIIFLSETVINRIKGGK